MLACWTTSLPAPRNLPSMLVVWAGTRLARAQLPSPLSPFFKLCQPNQSQDAVRVAEQRAELEAVARVEATARVQRTELAAAVRVEAAARMQRAELEASGPQFAYNLGRACALLAGAAVLYIGGEALLSRLLAVAAIATMSAFTSVAHAVKAGQMEWSQLAKLALAALEPARSLPSSPDTTAPVLEALAEVRACEWPF
jgi:hypothetical protein